MFIDVATIYKTQNFTLRFSLPLKGLRLGCLQDKVIQWIKVDYV